MAGIRLGAFEPDLEDGIRNALLLDGKADFLDVSYGLPGKAFRTGWKGILFQKQSMERRK